VLAARRSPPIPRLSRAAIRAALSWLLAGSLVGGWLLAQPPGRAGAALALLPLHVEMLLVGWIAQLALGVAYWILPRLEGEPSERGRFGAAVAAFVLLNSGLVLAGLAPLAGSAALLATGRALETAGAAAFAAHAWPRIRAATAA